MRRNSFFSLTILICSVVHAVSFADPADLTEQMKQSLVYLDVSISSYELSQPWKQTPVAKKSGYGCAVGPYEILTLAENVADATFIKTMSYGKSTYVPTTVKVIDYEVNLCLLELDKEAMSAPLTPLSFKDIYPEGKQLSIYWLSSGNHLTTANASLDRAQVERSMISFASTLTYYTTNVSRPFGDGQLCCYDEDAIGIAAWGTESDAGIIPAETINRFLASCKKEGYSGFATAGFRTAALLDPVMRKYLNVPDNIKNGVYVSDVFTLGTGSKELLKGDVILSINGKQLNPYGRYEHPQYKRISFHHILLQTPSGTAIPFKLLREGKMLDINVIARKTTSDNMLIPYYVYGKQHEFMVLGGYVFQKLNRDYLQLWGSDMESKSPPHLYQYFKRHAYKPTDEREDIVILSYVLPLEINVGYQQLSQLVVDSVNGAKIKSMKHFAEAVNSVGDEKSIEIKFEMDSPSLIIPKGELISANKKVAQLYGIPKMTHIEP